MAQRRRGQSSPPEPPRLSAPRTGKHHPWFYVPGRPLQTAERLAARHETEARKRAECENVQKYYSKCRQEAELYDNWQANRSLVKHDHRAKSLSPPRPPFAETERDAVQACADQKQLDQFVTQVAKLLCRYRETAANQPELRKQQSAIDYLLRNVHQDFQEVATRRQKFFMAFKRRYVGQSASIAGRGGYNFSNDPLRQVCFLIGEMLQFYHRTISDNLDRIQRVSTDGQLFSPPEQMELFDLNKRCLQILDLYRQLNECRDRNFQSLYTEERQTQWCRQQPIWIQEVSVWDNLAIKLLNSNFHLIRDRIERTLATENQRLKQRSKQLEQLDDFLSKQCHQNSKLKPVLYYRMDRFTNQDDSDGGSTALADSSNKP